MTQEESARSEDMGKYYRIFADNRDLNYDKFVAKGEKHIEDYKAYTSHNTHILNVQETVGKIMKTDFIKQEFNK